jgi:hypothetical protein
VAVLLVQVGEDQQHQKGYGSGDLQTCGNAIHRLLNALIAGPNEPWLGLSCQNKLIETTSVFCQVQALGTALSIF